jgi:hypothetical protein
VEENRTAGIVESGRHGFVVQAAFGRRRHDPPKVTCAVSPQQIIQDEKSTPRSKLGKDFNKFLSPPKMARKELNIRLENIPDRLTLTGAIKIDEIKETQVYSIRNIAVEMIGLLKHQQQEG